MIVALHTEVPQAVYYRPSPSLQGFGLGALGAVMSPAEIYTLAKDAGFPPDMAIRMTAVALRESGGDPGARNTKAPDDSYGLTQINMYGNLGPARMQQLGLSDPAQLLDPAANMRAAYQIWNGSERNFQIAWGGDASQYLGQATEAALSVDPSTVEVSGISLPENTSSMDSGVMIAAALLLGLVLSSRL